MFGSERIINLLSDIKKIEQDAVKRHEQERKEDLERIQRERETDLARYMQWRKDDKQAAAERLERQLEQQQESDRLARELFKANAEQAATYARDRDEIQTSIMQAHLATFQEKLAIEKAFIQAAQPIDKRSIYNEMERDRKAKARANKKNATTEETTTNG